jgi:predicted secreted protein
MIKRTKLFIIILLFLTCSLFAGDIANFVNLGFSSDSRYYMFAQYGVNEQTSYPYSYFYIVDVPSNDFVPNGVKNSSYSIFSQAGYDGIGALFTLLEDNTSIINSYSIDHVKTGRLLYFLIDGTVPKADLDFRDFITGNRYIVHLVQSSYGSGSNVSASFYIDLTVISSSGSSRNYQIGLPNYKRAGVKSYRIKQAILAPDGRSFIFVVEKEEVDTTGSNIRYMVETVQLN